MVGIVILVAVVLVHSKKKIVIPLRIVYKNRAQAYNRRINRNFVYRIFYSTDAKKKPNFGLNVRYAFSEINDACYFAKLLKCFGEYMCTIKWRVFLPH